MANKPPTGKVIEVWVVAPLALDEAYDVHGVFASHAMARDYITNEPVSSECEILRWTAFKFDDGERVALFHPHMFGPYELLTDYTSEPLRRRQELKAQAIAKLTDEEREACGLSR